MGHAHDDHDQHGQDPHSHAAPAAPTHMARTIVPLVLAVSVAGYAFGFMTRPEEAKWSTSRPVAGPGYTEPAPGVGPLDAPVVIHEVIDINCRFCALRNGYWKRLVTEFGDTVRLEVKLFPFLTPTSEPHAVAAMAANRQGRFEEYVDRLYLHQGAPLDTVGYLAIAKTSGLDAKQFEADLKDPALLAYVRKDKAAAEAVEVRATPTILVNGVSLPADASADAVRRLVREEAAKVKQLVRPGVDVRQARRIVASKNHPAGIAFSKYFIDGDVRDLVIDLRRGGTGRRPMEVPMSEPHGSHGQDDEAVPEF